MFAPIVFMHPLRVELNWRYFTIAAPIVWVQSWRRWRSWRTRRRSPGSAGVDRTSAYFLVLPFLQSFSSRAQRR